MEDEELSSINAEYDQQLRSLDTGTKAIILYFLQIVSKNVLQGDYNQAKYKLLNNAVTTLKSSLVKLIRDNTLIATEVSQKLMDVQIKTFENEVERLFNARKIKIPADLGIITKLTDTDKQKAIDSIMNKKWPDNLKVLDRIDLLGKKIKQITENTIIQGEIAGLSPDDLTDQLRSRFIDGGIEQRAALRLAVHTTNMVKEKTFSDIAQKSDAIIGIHIMRGAGGSVRCQICGEHAGDVGGSGVKYMKEDGDIDVMAEMPPYHARCLCFEVPIFKSVDEFIDAMDLQLFNNGIVRKNIDIRFGKPNSYLDVAGKNDTIKERWYYNNNGDVVLGIHTTNHGNAKTHPIVPHAHDWKNGKPINTRPLTPEEYIKNKNMFGGD